MSGNGVAGCGFRPHASGRPKHSSTFHSAPALPHTRAECDAPSGAMSCATWTPSSCWTSSASANLLAFLTIPPACVHLPVTRPPITPPPPPSALLPQGFETVTYMLEGKFTHEDFKGHSGTIGPGDLQWMTAGKGIMHSEVPADDSQSHGLQLWVNLAAKDKMTEPAYQELLAKDIPKVRHSGVVATVIAGEAFGVKSPVYTRTPTMYLDFAMDPGSTLHQPIPAGWNGFAYVLSGTGDFNSTLGKAHHTLVLTAEEGEDGLTVTAGTDAPLRFVLICGQPLGEPIVQHGPFVMNTQEEIYQAVRDFHDGANGFEGAAQWASEGGKTFR